MHVITVSPNASTELAVATMITAATVLAGAITRIVLSVLAVLVTRKTLEDLPGEPAEAAEIRTHRLAVLRAILAALAPSVRMRRSPAEERVVVVADTHQRTGKTSASASDGIPEAFTPDSVRRVPGRRRG